MAATRDLCHRGIVGWSMDNHHRAELVVDALTMALSRTVIDPDGLVHHSDKGGEYLSGDFAVAADVPGQRLSFGRTGNALDNAAMETVWATIKREITHIRGTLRFDTAPSPIVPGRLHLDLLQPPTPPNPPQTPHPRPVRHQVRSMTATTTCPRKRVNSREGTTTRTAWPSAFVKAASPGATFS